MFSAAKTAATSSGGYTLNRSLRFRSSASAYLNRTVNTGVNQYTYTFSCWLKRGALTSGYFGILGSGISAGGVYDENLRFDQTNDTLTFVLGNGYGTVFTTNQVFRDPSAWYHIVLAVDTTQATSSNRVKLYINGAQVSSFSTISYPSQNAYGVMQTATRPIVLGAYMNTTSVVGYNDCYLAECIYVDGQQLTAASFGSNNPTTGVWQAAKYTGTFGTAGWYLNFNNNASTTTLGYDTSGNSNNWTTNNISLTAGSTYDSMTDVPTLTSATVANYAVLNAVSTAMTMADGNLKWTGSGSTARNVEASIAMTTGKFYWEFTTVNITGGGGNLGCGVSNNLAMPATVEPGNNAYGWELLTSGSTTTMYKNNSGSVTSYSTYTAGDVWGIALDVDAGKLWFSKNGTWVAGGNPASGTTPDYTGLTGPLIPYGYGYNTGDVGIINFGQRPFAYTPPTGFVALNTYNLPTPSISNGANYMAATTYTGNGSTQSITNTVNGISFKPDLFWAKSRSSSGTHSLTDSVRGVNSQLFSNLTNAEGTQTDQVTAFNSNGVSLGANASGTGSTNVNTVTYVGWQWLAGAGTSSSNTNGSITSTVSVNATAGFSVVTYTGNGTGGATIGHGLGVAPQFIAVKSRSAVNDWLNYHVSLGNTQYLNLDLTSAAATSSAAWNNTSPTSTVFSVGTGPSVNSNGVTYVAYCWAAVAGFSKFGSYTGNGSTDGPFVYCGFRPRFILIKCSSNSSTNWIILDTSRDIYNLAGQSLEPNLSAAEYTPASSGYPCDILSNGFKWRDGGSQSDNYSGYTYIYAAFAENPFKNSLAR